MSRRLLVALLLMLTVALGVAWRFAPLHLPFFAWKYGGSILSAMAVYWLLAWLMPRASARTLAAGSATVSVLVEFSRLLDWAPLNAFRPTLAGRLLLGAIFSPKNIVAYLAGVALAAVFDIRLRRR